MQVVPDYIPASFGGLLLTFSFILMVAPYFAGHDFGIFKVPSFLPRVKRVLFWLGPLCLILSVLIHVRIGPKLCDEPISQVVTDAKVCGTVREEYVVTPATPKTCRLRDFGREGWRESEAITQSSGWRPGGSNPDNWCNELLTDFVRSRSLSAYESSVNDKGEESKKDFFGHVEYNYHCSLTVKWEPVFFEKTDEKCGMNPAEKSWRDVAATCSKRTGTKKVECPA